MEYAKAGPEDILMQVTVNNRGPDTATCHVLPQLWFRNTWSWKSDSAKPSLTEKRRGAIETKEAVLGTYNLYCDGNPKLLFTENETNAHRHFGSSETAGFFKDTFHEFVVNDRELAVNSQRCGTKAAAHYKLLVPARGSVSVRVHLVNRTMTKPFKEFDAVFEARRSEADEFYAELQQDIRFLQSEFTAARGIDVEINRHQLRRSLGYYLLLGLEFLIAADIIDTLLKPDARDLIVLGAIVAIRTVISYSLQTELSHTAAKTISAT